MLDVHLEVILQVFAHTRKVMHHRNVERLQFVAISNSAELQQLWRVDGSAAQNDLTRHHLLRLAATLGELDTGGSLAIEQHAVHHCPAQQIEVGPLEYRIQIGPSCTEPAAPLDVAIELGKALLLVAVYIAGDWIARLLH